jgi:hypothetical protein
MTDEPCAKEKATKLADPLHRERVERAKARLDAAVNEIEKGMYGKAEREYEAAKDELIAAVRASSPLQQALKVECTCRTIEKCERCEAIDASPLPEDAPQEEQDQDHGAGLIHPVARPLAETEPRPISERDRDCALQNALRYARSGNEHQLAEARRLLGLSPFTFAPNHTCRFCDGSFGSVSVSASEHSGLRAGAQRNKETLTSSPLIEQQENGMTWQPIETAPKDGTVIDLWAQSMELISRDGDDLRPSVAFRVPDAIWFDGYWTDADGNPHPHLEGFTNITFTHWMPLPSPPPEAP